MAKSVFLRYLSTDFNDIKTIFKCYWNEVLNVFWKALKIHFKLQNFKFFAKFKI